MAQDKDSGYGRGALGANKVVEAPQLPYRPQDPKSYRPAIGLVGCGGISEMHLRAYQKAGYNVVALCSRQREQVEKRRAEFFPEAETYLDYRALLDRQDVEVVDITTHPVERVEIMAAALRAGKHVLSQKPFVVDLDVGQRLVDLAAAQQRLLAVNQNGRWAPHFSYIRQAVAAGLLGQISSAQMAVHWDHNWIAETPFNQIEHLVLYDFGIHWFDIVTAFMGGRAADSVFAASTRSAGQRAAPPLMGRAVIDYGDAQASLFFNGDTLQGQRDTTYVVGTKGSIGSEGVDLTEQEVALFSAAGVARPTLAGTWFEDGFHGAMAELLCAVEEGRPPLNNAADNLTSLALCFAAVASAQRGAAVVPGTVRQVAV